MNYKG